WQGVSGLRDRSRPLRRRPLRGPPPPRRATTERPSAGDCHRCPYRDRLRGRVAGPAVALLRRPEPLRLRRPAPPTRELRRPTLSDAAPREPTVIGLRGPARRRRRLRETRFHD